MMVKKPNFLILSGDGMNCESETAYALEQSGAQSTVITLQTLIQNPKKLKNFQGLVIPGGFSFGDELGSGLIYARKIEHHLGDLLQDFVQSGKPVMGICNGFQVLLHLGFLKPGQLLPNDHYHFEDRWVELRPAAATESIWLGEESSWDQVHWVLPIRNGEGRLKTAPSRNFPLYYASDVNGSDYMAASMCDESGRIFGLMPHPEAYIHPWQCPWHYPRKWKQNSKQPLGEFLFKNGVRFCDGN